MNATHLVEKTGGYGSPPLPPSPLDSSLRSLRTPSRSPLLSAADPNPGLTVPPCGSEIHRHGADFIHVDDVIGRAGAVLHEVFARHVFRSAPASGTHFA